MIATVNVSAKFDASNKEDAYSKMANHFALLARLEGNGMSHDTGAKWFEGTVDVSLADKPEAATPAARV